MTRARAVARLSPPQTGLRLLGSLAALLIHTAPGAAQPHPPPAHAQLAPGVHLFRTEPYGDAGLDGNSVVIEGRDAVLVFDANGTPAAARAVLARLRELTSKPVRYLVLSHWHWDHWSGAEVYREAFPDLTIISHEASRRLMAGPAIAFNQPGLDEQLPGHIAQVRQALERARAAAPPTADTTRLTEHLARDEWFLEQKRSVRHTLADRTFTDSLTLDLGNRDVRLMHLDRAITPGDTWLWLPAERIAVLGDLLINPITFALFSYPDGWIRTLEAIDARDATLLIPGHGDALRDEGLLQATLALLRRQREIALEVRQRGGTWETARDTALTDPVVRDLRAGITGGDPGLEQQFPLYLVEWFLRRVFQEADGPLPDTIPAIP